MFGNILCMLGIHKWILETEMEIDTYEFYASEQVSKVRCKRCKKENKDYKILRRLSGKKVKCDVCHKTFLDTEGHKYKLREIGNLTPKPGSRGAGLLAMAYTYSVMGHTEVIFYVCENCFGRDFI